MTVIPAIVPLAGKFCVNQVGDGLGVEAGLGEKRVGVVAVREGLGQAEAAHARAGGAVRGGELAGNALAEASVHAAVLERHKEAHALLREGDEALDVDGVGPAGVDKRDVDAAGGTGAAATTSASLLRVVAEEGAHVTITEVVGVGSSQQHLESVGVDADDDARIEVRQYALGGGTVAFGTAVSLSGDRARANIGLRYFADGKDRLDVNHVVRQRGKNTIAHVRENGILDDAAEKALRATIDLVHGARGSKGDEAENVLVFGDDVVNKTVPVILCDEDDVQGNHGATIGTVGPEQMDYLADRGLSRKDAEALFVRALFEDAIINAPEAHAHDVAVRQAERVLGAEVAHDFDASAQLAEGEEA